MSGAERFERIVRIGAGATGTVWRGYDRRLHRTCALKLVRSPDPRTLVRVVLEQAVRLDHPHLLCPYAWQADDEGTLLATDLMAGGSLDTLLADHGPLPWRYAAEILAQVVSGLAAVHAAGLVHRDVKPANVLLAATGTGAPRARLGDFGIAYPAGGPRLTELGFVVGTPGYLPPEVLAGAPPAPPQDLYAVGLLGRQLLTGAESPERATGCPDTPVTPLLAALCAADPARRPDAAAAAAMLAELRAGTVLTLPARTADGEPIEVFDVLPAEPTAQHPPGRDAPATEDGAASGEQSARPSPTARQPGVAAEADGPAPTRRVPPAEPHREPAPPAEPHRFWVLRAGPRRRVLLVAALLTAVLGGGAVAAARATGDRAGPDGTGATPTPSATGAGAVRAGTPCDWQDVGIATPGPDGRQLHCTYRSGRYVWR
jgi:serine/threonine-protein kinase